MRTVAQELSTACVAYAYADETGNLVWRARYADRIETIARDYLPHGSGFDCGNVVLHEKSNESVLFVDTTYHAMNDVGYYVAYVDVRITVRATFTGYDVYARACATPEDRDTLEKDGVDIDSLEDYVADTFHEALSQEYPSHE